MHLKEAMKQQRDIFALAQPFGGLFGAGTQMKTGEDTPKLKVNMSRLGDLAQVWAHIGYNPPGSFSPVSIDGAGAALSDEDQDDLIHSLNKLHVLLDSK